MKFKVTGTGRFSKTRDDGSLIEVEMIRPSSFWQQQGAVPGAQVFMEFPELEVSTHATVRKVAPCPPIAEGTGNVFTARIITLTATDLVELTLATGETITGTPPHPIWSVEEDDWIELGDLEPSDQVQTESGPLEVIAVNYRTTAETVYNLEVHGHHVYYIGDDGVLVHNSGTSTYKKIEKQGGVYVLKNNRGKIVRTGRTNDLARRAKEHLRQFSHLKFHTVYKTNSYKAQRGLAHKLHNLYKPALDKVRELNPSNPRHRNYVNAANAFLGSLAKKR